MLKQRVRPPITATTAGLILFALIICALVVDFSLRSTVLKHALPKLMQRCVDLGVLAISVCGSIGLGARILRHFWIRTRNSMEEAVVGAAVGFTIQHTAVLILALLQSVRAWTLLLAIVLPLVLGFTDLKRILRDAGLHHRPPRMSAVIWLGGGLAFVYGLMALSPEVGIDPLSYHLAIPKEYLAHGGATSVPDNFMRIFPPAMSMQYMVLLGLASEWTPKLLNGVWFLLMLGAMRAFLPHHSRVKGLLGMAILLFMAEWAVWHAIGQANVEFHWGFYGCLGLLVMVDGLRREDSPYRKCWPWLVGLCIGSAISSKLQALSCLVGTLVLMSWLLAERRIRVRDVATVLVAAGVVYLPVLVRNLVYSDEPLLLAMSNRLGLGLDPLEVARFTGLADIQGLFKTKLDAVSFALMPFWAYRDGWFPSTTFDAFMTPFPLVTVPMAFLLIRRREIRWILVYLSGFYLAWVMTAPLPRYAFPVFPILAFLTVETTFGLLHRAPQGWRKPLQRAVRTGFMAFCLISLLQAANVSAVAISQAIPYTFGLLDLESALRRSQAGETMAVGNFLRAQSAGMDPSDNKVFMVFASQAYYLGQRYYNDPFYINLNLLQSASSGSSGPHGWLRLKGYRWVLADLDRRESWMRNESKQNPRINPSREGLAKLDAMLDFWNGSVKPGLVFRGRFGKLELYEIPDESGTHNVRTPP